MPKKYVLKLSFTQAPEEGIELSIIVPAHDEEENLKPLLADLSGILSTIDAPAEVILVCDHCTDDTLRRAQTLRATYGFLRVLDNDGKKGMGNAIKKGITDAKGEFVVFVMADCTCPLESIATMLDSMKNNDLDIAIFSRYLHREDSASIPLRYRFWSRAFRLAARILVGITVGDPTDAYRMVKKNFFERFPISRGDFSFSAEITLKAWLAGLRIGEIRGKQMERSVGRSSFSFKKMAWPYASLLLEAVWERAKRKLRGLLTSRL